MSSIPILDRAHAGPLAEAPERRPAPRPPRGARVLPKRTAFRFNSARLRRLLLAWPFPLAVLALWWTATANDWVPSQILPAPSVVADTLRDLLASGELQMHLAISLERVVYGFLLGSLLGLLLGVGMGLSVVVKEYLYPTFRLLAQVPSLGWLPLLMMLVGIDEALKIILISKAAFVPVTMNTYKGIQGVSAQLVEVARVFRFSRWQLLRKVVFPAAFPPIWNGVRYGLTHAWLALVAVELLASSEGLGFLMVYGRQLYQLDVVLAAVVVVGAVGFLLDRLLTQFEGRLLRWRRESF